MPVKKLRLCFLFACLVFLFCACGSGQDPVIPSAEPNTTMQTEAEMSFSYDQLRFTDFLFSSGAGAWGTTLYIAEDGSFSGVYHDSEMGESAEGYPHGTVYYCDFYGQLGTPVRIDDYTYELPLKVLRYGHVPESQEILDQQRYCYTTAFGIEDTFSLILYLPGIPVESLPMEYRQWVGLHTEDTGELSFWGLYNEPQQQGFSSSDRIRRAREMVEIAEETEISINSILNETSIQSEMNTATQQRYLLWDDTMNTLWAVLKQSLEEDAMNALTNDQLVWIREKERSATDAAAEFEGGSIQPTVYYTVAADMTKERVYYLLTFLP